MSDPLPPDPYLALGVPKDASASAIKTQYRKLVLKFHPDKVQDEAQKQAASDKFHLIQTAYEIISDDERRARYDAQCKLAELRKEMMERQGAPGPGSRSAEPRSAPRTPPAESPRASYFASRPSERNERVQPQYEERKPASYSDPEYLDTSSRTANRKDPLSERTTKRAFTRDTKERDRATTKRSQRATREERSRKTDREIRRDRDRKSSYAYVEDLNSSDSDRYEAQSRKRREEDEEKKAREAFYGSTRKQEDVNYGYYDSDERSKIHSAREYMARRSKRIESESRPEPVRQSSMKDKLAYFTGGRPTVVRADSGRPKPVSRESDFRRSLRDGERKSSVEIVDEPRRPPTLAQTRSSPADIRIPTFEKQRAHSVQIDSKDLPDSPPKIRRAETMPMQRERESRPETRRRESNQPPRSSNLRQAEFTDGLPTPSTTPDYPEAGSNKYHRYGQQYADDGEYPTPEGYRTELREPSAPMPSRRYTRSPSPMRERGMRSDRLDRDRTPRGTQSRYAPSSPQRPSTGPRTTSHSYVYTPSGVEPYARPSPVSRENSGRTSSGRTPAVDPLLYGEVRTTQSPKQPYNRYETPELSPRYQREIRPEDLRPQTGYGYVRRPDVVRPTYNRHGSNPVYAR